ncbi:MAG TPA: penicillin-binding protein [Candidatus Saccharimonadales bacterium]|nr:penicillin-binding protein [Candidatus Saccharimonadales bacterium]
MAKSPNSANTRLYYLAGFLALWFVLICARLVWLQVVSYGDYTRLAARQQQRSIEVSPVRGNIYDRHGNNLAMSVSVDSVFAVPSAIPDIHGISRILGKVLKADPDEIENHLRASRAFAWVARKVDSETSARIRSLNLKGIYFQKESKRFYPKRELAAQVLGYVGLDDEGLGGVEREFEHKLRGKAGTILISMDAKQRWFGRVDRSADPGENLVLTMDEKIQYIAEHELDRAMQETHAEAGTVIVQDPQTGEILALANRPVFNPNSLRGADPRTLKDRAVTDIYEPGSTFKVVTLAAALEENLTRPEEVIDCQMGSIMVNRLKIRDHRAFGELTVAQILQNSSDVGAIKIALRLGEDRFDRYIRAFGFGAQTGIELPGETRGLTKPASRWSKVSIGAISMGQEIGVSPLQLVSMVSTIANDGLYVPPRIVIGTMPPRSTEQRLTFHPAEGRRVISAMTAAQMKRMMQGVILHGTGLKAVLNGYTVAGKTGTAQKIDPATGAYSRTRHVASFGGFAPVNNPALSVLVVLDSPVGQHEGGQVAAPVFARVAQQVLAYLNVPHDAEFQDQKSFLLRAQAQGQDVAEGSPDVLSLEAVAPALQPQPPVAHAAPENAVASAVPVAIRPVQSDSSVPGPPAPSALRGTIVLDVGGGVTVPDFTGKSLRAALEQAQAMGLELEVTGSGVARSQSPAAGARAPHSGHVSVRFGR